VNQKLLISDTNILIDMTAGGILEKIFLLEYEFAVPDVLFHEELHELSGRWKGVWVSGNWRFDFLWRSARLPKAG